MSQTYISCTHTSSTLEGATLKYSIPTLYQPKSWRIPLNYFIFDLHDFPLSTHFTRLFCPRARTTPVVFFFLLLYILDPLKRQNRAQNFRMNLAVFSLHWGDTTWSSLRGSSVKLRISFRFFFFAFLFFFCLASLFCKVFILELSSPWRRGGWRTQQNSILCT